MAKHTLNLRAALLVIVLASTSVGIGEALGQTDPMRGPAHPREGLVTPSPGQAGTSAKTSVARVNAAGNPLWAIPLATLHATRERPIFMPSRRPPPQAAARVQMPTTIAVAAPAAPELPSLQLLGSLYGENEGVAVFMDEKTRSLVRLKPGEGYGGWLLRTINGREVVLGKDSRTLKLALPSPMPGAEK